MNPTYDGVPSEQWLDGLHSESKYNTKHILAAFAYFGIPATFFDVGCGDGTVVNIARKLGVEAYGIDQLVQPDWPPYFFHHNLVDDFILPEPVDMIICTEVAEHLHESAHSTFMKMIVKNMKENSQSRLIFTAAHPGQDGTGHLACVVEGTDVRALDVRAATRRFYQGETVAIVTQSGNHLTVTPNHPILTEGGWVAAGLLNEGSNIISGDFHQRESFNVVPDYNERPTKIEKIFCSFAKMQKSFPLCVPLTAEDFHGDGIPNSNVEIVYANRFREDAVVSSLLQPMSHLSVQNRHSISPVLCRHSLFSLDNNRNLPPNQSLVSLFRYSPALLGGHGGGSQFHSLRPVADNNALPLQCSSNAGLFNSEFESYPSGRFPAQVSILDDRNIKSGSESFPSRSNGNIFADQNSSRSSIIDMSLDSQFCEGFPGEVTIDKIVKIERSYFSGHVYNLETRDGWYVANGIITHNCRPAEYWRREFTELGLTFHRIDTINLALLWTNIESGLVHLAANLQVFEK